MRVQYVVGVHALGPAHRGQSPGSFSSMLALFYQPRPMNREKGSFLWDLQRNIAILWHYTKQIHLDMTNFLSLSSVFIHADLVFLAIIFTTSGSYISSLLAITVGVTARTLNSKPQEILI